MHKTSKYEVIKHNLENLLFLIELIEEFFTASEKFPSE